MIFIARMVVLVVFLVLVVLIVLAVLVALVVLLVVVVLVVLVVLVVVVVVLVVFVVCPLVSRWPCWELAAPGLPPPRFTLVATITPQRTAAAITNPTVCHQVAPHCNLGLGLTWGPGLTG